MAPGKLGYNREGVIVSGIETGKVTPRSPERDTSKTNTRQDDAAYSLLKTLTKLGGVGTAGLATLIIGGMTWLKSELATTTKEIVREEIRPLDDRIKKLEIEAEVTKRTAGK